MIIKSSSIEFYRIEFIEKKKHLFSSTDDDLSTYSNVHPFTDDFQTIFNYINIKIDEPNSMREQVLARGKKHRMWIDSIANGDLYQY